MLKKHLLYCFVCLAFAVAGSACATGGDAERNKSAQAVAEQPESGDQARNNNARAGKNETASVDKNSPDSSDTAEIAVDKQSANVSAANDDEIRHLEPFHFTVVKDWLKTKPNLRVLGEADYGAKRLKLLRELNNNPKAHPFYITGDFNRDGTPEFAVMMVSRKNKSVRAVAVFDSPPVTRAKFIKPTFFIGDIKDDGGDVVLYNSENSDETGIYVGEAGSDSGFLLKPKGKTYKVVDPLAEEN